jgi:hypothetical protein
LQLALGEAAVIVGLRILGIDPDQEVVIRDGPLDISGDMVGPSPVLDRTDMARVEVDNLTEIANRKFRITLFQIGQTAADDGVDLSRFEFDRTIEAGDSSVAIVLQAVCFGAPTKVGGQYVPALSSRPGVRMARGDLVSR